MEQINALDTGVGVYDFSPEALEENDAAMTSGEGRDSDAQE